MLAITLAMCKQFRDFIQNLFVIFEIMFFEAEDLELSESVLYGIDYSICCSENSLGMDSLRGSSYYSLATLTTSLSNTNIIC